MGSLCQDVEFPRGFWEKLLNNSFSSLDFCQSGYFGKACLVQTEGSLGEAFVTGAYLEASFLVAQFEEACCDVAFLVVAFGASPFVEGFLLHEFLGLSLLLLGSS